MMDGKKIKTIFDSYILDYEWEVEGIWSSKSDYGYNNVFFEHVIMVTNSGANFVLTSFWDA